MRVRAKANGNVLDVDEERAQALIATGIYEAVDGEADEKPKKATTYKRRDLRAEE